MRKTVISAAVGAVGIFCIGVVLAFGADYVKCHQKWNAIKEDARAYDPIAGCQIKVIDMGPGMQVWLPAEAVKFTLN